MVLFALVDANYNFFMYLDIGKPGSTSAPTVWQESTLKKALENGKLNCLTIQYDYLCEEVNFINISRGAFMYKCFAHSFFCIYI